MQGRLSRAAEDIVNPLELFLSEKAAAITDAPRMPSSMEQQSAQTLSDPGERALAGIAAVSGHMINKVVPPVGGIILSSMAREGAVEVPHGVRHEVARLDEFKYDSPKKTTDFMGLFRIKPRPYLTAAGLKRDIVTAPPFIEELTRTTDLVDSFIDKHNLGKEGVRIRLTGSWIDRVSGPSYDFATKRVTLPELSAETALHELGHARDYTKSRFRNLRKVFESAGNRAALVGIPAALIAGDEIKKMFPGTIDDKVIGFVQENAPEITAATLAATTLYPEAKASAYAIKHIAQHEGKDAAIRAAKKLLPAYGTYLLGVIPAVVGMSLARKYMRQARAEKPEAEKSAAARAQKSALKEIGEMFHSIAAETGADLANVSKQIGSGMVEVLKDKNLPHRLARSARQVGTSPEFAWGALSSAIPAATGSLYLYGSGPGRAVRQRMAEEQTKKITGHPPGSEDVEAWRERNPGRFAGLVAMGAALSGGVLAKLVSDIGRAL